MNIILVFSTIVAEKLVIAESKKRFRLGKCKNLRHRENIVEVNMRDRVSTLKVVRVLDVNVVRLNGEPGSYNSHQPSKTARVCGSKAQWTKRMVGECQITWQNSLLGSPCLTHSKCREEEMLRHLFRSSEDIKLPLRNRPTKH